MNTKTRCTWVSDGTPGQGGHHSADLLVVWHGAAAPIEVCGYHASRPDVMRKLYAAS